MTGIAKFGNVAVLAQQIRLIRINGVDRPLEMVDTDNKVHQLVGTRGTDLETAIETWQTALNGDGKPAKPAARASRSKKTTKKKAATPADAEG